MAESIDNEDFENEKKSAELKKLNKEIAKIEAETEEIISKRGSAWAPTVIAICSVIIVYVNGCLTDSKSKLVQEETKNLKIKNDKSRVIFHRDSLILISQKNKIQRQLDSLSQKFIEDKKKFDIERLKYGFVISQKEKEIGGLVAKNDSSIKNNTKLINCYSRATDFIKTYCIKDDEIPYQEAFATILKPFYHRFSRTFDEIAKMDVSSMNYQQFLIGVADYRIGSSQLIDKFIISKDNKKTIELSVIQGHYNRKLISDLHNKLTGQFDCWKKLNEVERLQLLNQSINRTR